MESKNLVNQQSSTEFLDTLVAKAETPKTGKRIITRTVEEIREAARQAIENGADWWQFNEHGDTT